MTGTRAGIWAGAVSLSVVAGCATTTTTDVRSSAGPARGQHASASGEPINRPVPTRTSRVRAEISPRGTVPYDGLALPLVSPDGRYIVTQTGIAPGWPTVLAQDDAVVPYATRLEIYRLDSTHDAVAFVTEIDMPLLLGRSYNADGFLVEAPQEDGSRWIGFAAWATGEIEWIVADEAVNAFAALGPDDRLAWSRRPVDGWDDHFELVIRHGDTEWSLSSHAESWLMPTWSGRGDGLFVLMLSDGYLEATYGIATNEMGFRQSQQRIALAEAASVVSAYQTMGAQVVAPPFIGSAEHFVFHHPARARMAVWQPRRSGSRSGGLTFFDPDTFAAVLEDGDVALVTTQRHLLRQTMPQRNAERTTPGRQELIAGLQVPRITTSPHWRYVLLSPLDGNIGIIAMNPVE